MKLKKSTINKLVLMAKKTAKTCTKVSGHPYGAYTPKAPMSIVKK